MIKTWRSLFLLIGLLAACNLPVPGATSTPAATVATKARPPAASPAAATRIIFPPPTAIPSTVPTKAAASNLWHVSYPSAGAKPLLLAARLDAQARPLGLSKPLDLPLEQSYIGPRLYRLASSPNGQKALAVLVSRDTPLPHLVDLQAGQAKALAALAGAGFLGWHPDGKSALFLRGPGEEIPLLVELDSGKETAIPMPEGGGYPPSVSALAYSPDGTTLADVLAYSPTVNRSGWALEIGLRPAGNGSLDGRKVLCSQKGVMYAVGGSLKWSPEGSLLAWVAVSETTRRAELWLAETGSGKCRSLGVLSQGPDYTAPPAWSPDGSWIAALRILRAVEPAGAEAEVLLIDPLSGRSEVLLSPESLPAPESTSGESPSALLPVFGLTGLEWSPDGRYLALALARGNSGDILAAEISSGGASLKLASPTLLAGPTPPLAPFLWK